MSARRVGDHGLAVRRAVRTLLADHAVEPLLTSGNVGVGLSGGADSLALTDGAVYAAAQQDLTVTALVVDHGLQAGSADVAATAAAQAEQLGAQAKILTVDLPPDASEGQARDARYAALRKAMPDALILLGHTVDDQAETVLLGLGRGSGPRSIAGMRPLDPPWGRPLLDVRRTTTQGACRELGLTPWDDPHNADPRFTRARLRHEVLPLLEDVLHGGVAGALARTAAQLREDGDALDALATRAQTTDVEQLEALHPAIRRRVIRRWLLDEGVRDLTDGHLRAVDDLIGRWHGQGGVWLPGDLVVERVSGRLSLQPAGTPGK